MKIEKGETVIVILHTPREKLLGVLDEINPPAYRFAGSILDISTTGAARSRRANSICR
jgi:hypothetical protein